MNIRCINSNDKTNFKAGIAWNPAIPEKFAAKLRINSEGFARGTERSDSCLFIKQVSENGDIERAFLGKMRVVAVEDDMANVKVKGISRSDVPRVNVNSPTFVTEMVERYNALLNGTRAFKKAAESGRTIEDIRLN